jgi:hypothetical protein
MPAIESGSTTLRNPPLGKNSANLSLLPRLPHSEKGFREKTSRKPTQRKLGEPVWQRIKTKAIAWRTLYDNFNLELKLEELEQLKVLWKEYGAQNYVIRKDLVNFLLELKGLLKSKGVSSYPSSVTKRQKKIRVRSHLSSNIMSGRLIVI